MTPHQDDESDMVANGFRPLVLGLLVAILIAVGAYWLAGCASNEGGTQRQGTVEAVTEAQVRAAVKAEVDAGVVKLERTVTDQSQRAVEATQRATVAIQSTDQSSSDKWVNRISVACLGIALISETVALILMAWSSILRKRIILAGEKPGEPVAPWIDTTGPRQ